MLNRSIQTILQSALDLLKQGELEQAHSSLTKHLEQDLENEQLIYALKGTTFWCERVQYAMTFSDDFSRGEYVITQWKPFLEFIKRMGEYNEPVVYALKCCAFTIALQFYKSLLTGSTAIHTAEIYRKAGLCYKALGDYDTAISCLRYASDIDASSSAVLAELADAYAFSGEIRLAKVFFREAFFKNASEIDFCFLESDIICTLIDKVAAKGYEGEALAEWIPVYGTLNGVLNVKRELKALEFGRLKQAIYALENELRGQNVKNEKILVPRLINYYFWLVDHYVNGMVERSKIDEILLRIKLLDEKIHDCYVQ